MSQPVVSASSLSKLTGGGSSNNSSTSHHVASSSGSDIERIMAKIEQDNRVLAELDKSRATISKFSNPGVLSSLFLFLSSLLFFFVVVVFFFFFYFPFSTSYSFALDPAIRLFIAAKNSTTEELLVSLSLSHCETNPLNCTMWLRPLDVVVVVVVVTN